MGDRVLFQMYSGHRNQLIERQEFFLAAGQNRILAHLSDAAIESEANKVSEDSWADRGKNFNPDYHDESYGLEEAENDGMWRYELLVDLRKSMRLSIIATFYHEWEKQLRDWLVREMQHWHRGENASRAIWTTPISDILNLLKELGIDVRKQGYFQSLDSCRLVTNVFKHGDGQSLDELKKKHSDFIISKTNRIFAKTFGLDTLDHTNLNVSDADMVAFSNAILEFWKSIPENVFESQINKFPKWLIDAVKEGKKSKQK